MAVGTGYGSGGFTGGGGGGGGGGIGPPGPPGPSGPQGPAGATGAQGPAGPQGPIGPQGPVGPVTEIKGSVPTSGALPPSGNAIGDAYITEDTGHLWVWNGTNWVDAGMIVGPPGPTGAQGPIGATGPPGVTGPQGPAGPTGGTGATGAQGPAGPQGPVGPQGPAGAADLSGVLAGTCISITPSGSDIIINAAIGCIQTPWIQPVNAANNAIYNVPVVQFTPAGQIYPSSAAGNAMIVWGGTGGVLLRAPAGVSTSGTFVPAYPLDVVGNVNSSGCYLIGGVAYACSDGAGGVALSNISTINGSAPGSGGTPAPPNQSVQWNNNGAFGGSAQLTWTGNALNVTSAASGGFPLNVASSNSLGYSGATFSVLNGDSVAIFATSNVGPPTDFSNPAAEVSTAYVRSILPIELVSVDSAIMLRPNAATAGAVYVETTGIGLGVNKSPSYPLDVAGDVNSTGCYLINGNAFACSDGASGINLSNITTINGSPPGGGSLANLAAGTCIALDTSSPPTVRINAQVGCIQTPWQQNVNAADFTLSNLEYLTMGNAKSGDSINIDINPTITPVTCSITWDSQSAFIHYQTTPQLFTLACNTSITFKSGSPLIERMRVAANGNIGILNVAPAYPLDVAGDVNITGVYRVSGVPLSTGQPQTPWLSIIDGGNFRLTNCSGVNIGTASTYVGIFGVRGNASSPVIPNNNFGLATFQGVSSGSVWGALQLGVDVNSGAWIQSSTISPASGAIMSLNPLGGNVGIGQSAPAYPLDVNGDINISSGHVYRINGVPLSTGGTPAGSNSQVQFNNNGAFGASANLTWNNTNSALSVSDSLTVTSLGGSQFPVIIQQGSGLVAGIRFITATSQTLDFAVTGGIATGLPAGINPNSATLRTAYSLFINAAQTTVSGPFNVSASPTNFYVATTGVGIGVASPRTNLTIIPAANPTTWSNFQLCIGEQTNNTQYGLYIGYSLGNNQGYIESIAGAQGVTLNLNHFGGAPVVCGGPLIVGAGSTGVTGGDISLARPGGTQGYAFFGGGQYIGWNGSAWVFSPALPASGGGPTVQSVVTGSRAMGGTYQNATGKPLYVNVGLSIGAAAFGWVYCDGSASPGTQVGRFSGVTGVNLYNNIFFIVMPGYYYRVFDQNSATSILDWIEYY